MGESVYISEFAKSRNKTVSAITNYISKHENEFKGHIRKDGNKSVLDKAAIELLEKKYPLTKPIEIVRDTESMEKLLKAQEVIIQLQAQINQEQKLLAQAESMQLLLTDKQNLIDKLEGDRIQIEKENAELKEELARLKNRSLLDRILNK